MRFTIIRKADQQTEAGALPSEQMLTLMGRYMQQMNDAAQEDRLRADADARK